MTLEPTDPPGPHDEPDLPSTRITRLAERQRNDREALYDVLDSALVAHVAVVREGVPVVLPLLHARDGERLLLHGSTGGGLLREAAAGAPVTVAVTVVDALVVADSLFESSANYRSAVIFGRCSVVPPGGRLAALRALSDRLLPGRWTEVRPPTPKELAATLVLEMPLDHASVKVRSGPPSPADTSAEPPPDGVPLWWGVVPLAQTPGHPVTAPDVPEGTPLPPSVLGLLHASSR
jgi:nitroimidazol reductase NimA-like FMN-containing flavoprotein (pyridoxamine 5'-phosphate oxidase superfamily)